MSIAISKYTDRAGRAAGRFLSSFSYVLTTLLFYIILCVVSFLALRISIGPDKGASFIAFEIATGGDPYNFKELAASHPVMWCWILVLHLLSWLIVPVLAATAVDAAYRRWDERRIELELELRGEMSGVLGRHIGISEEEADRLAQQILSDAHKKLAPGSKKD